jgi:DNA-binding NarL/FixJ family response regulator
VSGLAILQALIERPVPTPREREVIIGIAAGLSNKEIATRLAIETKTVDVHRCNVYRKLELKGIAQVCRYAVENGLVNWTKENA